ncbi:MAG: ribonuclease P protein component [Flavobacteriaceae bacterium]
MDFTFRKQEKLKHKKLIEILFSEGKSISIFPLRIVFLENDHDGNKLLQVGFSVPKRLIKKAVDRNRIKRQLREVYRLNKKEFYQSIDKKYIMMVVFMDDKKYDSSILNTKMINIFDKFIKSIS